MNPDGKPLAPAGQQVPADQQRENVPDIDAMDFTNEGELGDGDVSCSPGGAVPNVIPKNNIIYDQQQQQSGQFSTMMENQNGNGNINMGDSTLMNRNTENDNASSMLCYAMLCYAIYMLCYAMLCYIYAQSLKEKINKLAPSIPELLLRTRLKKNGNAGRPQSGESKRESVERRNRSQKHVGDVWTKGKEQWNRWDDLQNKINALDDETARFLGKKGEYYRAKLASINGALKQPRDILEKVTDCHGSQKQTKANKLFLDVLYQEQEDKLNFFHEILDLLVDLHTATPNFWPQNVNDQQKMAELPRQPQSVEPMDIGPVEPPVDLPQAPENEMEMDIESLRDTPSPFGEIDEEMQEICMEGLGDISKESFWSEMPQEKFGFVPPVPNNLEEEDTEDAGLDDHGHHVPSM